LKKERMPLAFQMVVCYLAPMKLQFKYRGRTIVDEDVIFINRLIEKNPGDSRRALSKKLCQAWNWVQENGSLKDMVCRSLMLELHRAGYIKLPPVKQHPRNPLAIRKKPAVIKIDQTPIDGKLVDIRPLEFCQVRRTAEEKRFNGLIERYHYLGYCHPVGEQLKYLVYSEKRPVACFAWSSAPRHIGCRDRFIGWSQKDRKAHIQFIAYNSRFLILPWVRVKLLSSHLLGQMAKIIAADWKKLYGHPIHYLETFVDKERFAGTCYKAANWIYMGDTTGRGKNDQTHIPNRSIEAVWGYPLCKDFRNRLSGGMQ
jgi:hypothetical protein